MTTLAPPHRHSVRAISGAANLKTLPTLFLFLFATTTFAQNAPPQSAAAPGCGTDNTKFDVKSDRSQHPFLNPAPGKALIYFLQDNTYFESRPRPTSRFGIDGRWIGATQSNAYFYLSVDPGEHHLCADWQSFYIVTASGLRSAAAHFTAESGGIYFFIVRNRFIREHGILGMKLEALDSDEAQLLMSRFALSTFHPKK
jgi:hypothetical protein